MIAFEPYLTPEEYQWMAKSLHLETFRKGELIHRHGSSCVGLLHILKGRISFSVMSDEGREIALFRGEAGETCILSAACVLQTISFDTQIMAEEATEAEILPAPTLARLMASNTNVERIVYKLAAARFARTTTILERVLFFSLEKRLAVFLLEEMTRRGGLTFSATHEQVAKFIGSSREVVTRTLNQFASRDLVILGRGTITVTDPDALEALTA